MRRSLLLLLPALLLPTSCDDQELTGDVDPHWGFSGWFVLRYDVSDVASGLSCEANGTARVIPRGTSLGGHYDLLLVCLGPDGETEDSLSGTFSDGTLLDRRMSVQAGGCAFEGFLVGEPPTGGATGDAQCSTGAGAGAQLTGEWAMNRGAVSITVSPDTAVMPPGDTYGLSTTITLPSGYESSEWSVTWESLDPEIATVDASGEVVGVSIGVASIRAVTVPKYPLEEPVETVAPVRVGWKFVGLAVGASHACAITFTGRLYCWGRGDVGQLGHGTAVERQPEPVRVGMPGSDLRFSAVSPGYLHTCGMAGAGGAFCWGSNEDGALGDGTGLSSAVPVRVSTETGSGGAFSSVVAGAHASCGTEGSQVFCWGSDAGGQLGRGTVGGPDQLAPVKVDLEGEDEDLFLLTLSRSPSGRAGHVCATYWVEEPGPFRPPWHFPESFFCWGRGADGELGSGGTIDIGVPTAVVPPDEDGPFTSITAGTDHTCAIEGSLWRWSGPAFCWGDASSGALGTGSTDPAIQALPVPVAGGHYFDQLSAGDHFTCAVEEGNAFCWGRGDSHQLGNGQAVDRLEPTLVAGELGFASVSAGSGFACGLTGNGDIYCWGANDYGQLGTGDFEPRATPTLIGLED